MTAMVKMSGRRLMMTAVMAMIGMVKKKMKGGRTS